jgi:hypothetical protein
MWKMFVLVVVLGGALAVTLFSVIAGFDGSAISLPVWIALGLATLLSLGLAGGLMALMHYSARHGYDDHFQPEPPPE